MSLTLMGQTCRLSFLLLLFICLGFSGCPVIIRMIVYVRSSFIDVFYVLVLPCDLL